MPEEIVYKKFYRKADEHLNGKFKDKHGKQINQKIKPYVVLQYLLKYSDENNVLSAYDIISLLEDVGLSAERRSIYRDIEEINKVALAMEEECSIEEAEEMLFDDDSDDLKLVLYNKTKKGFYVRQRKFDLQEIRLLAECVYSAKFVSEAQAKRLTLRFINPLLDTVIDRFGTKDVLYTKVDSGHFTVSAQVEISKQFFGWLCGFGNRVRIESPVEVKEEFKEHIKKIQGCYQDE